MTQRLQNLLSEQGLEAYLVYDFRGSNYVGRKALGFAPDTTRKWVALITADAVRWLIPALEASYFDPYPGEKLVYRTFSEFEAYLKALISNLNTLAIDTSSENAVAVLDIMPAGFMQLLKRINPGLKLVSAGDFTAAISSTWGEKGLVTHQRATAGINQAREALLELLAQKMRDQKPITDYEATNFVLEQYDKAGIYSEDGICIVSTNAQTGNPHYWAKPDSAKLIKPNSVLLMDMWAKQKDNPEAIYSDSTFMGWIGPDPIPQKVQEIWDIVRKARDIGIDLVDKESKNGVEGWQVDRAVRDYIIKAGYGDYFIHRTGHSMDRQEHGSGADLDDYEKHDTRKLLTDSGFSIEPGIYLPEFGVRSEIDMYIDPQGKASVTTYKQDQLFII